MMWRCERKQACNGRLWTVGKNGAVVRVVGTHNHTGSPFKAGIIKFKTVIKEKAACSLEVIWLAETIEGGVFILACLEHTRSGSGRCR